jgi:hypothetical protein
MIADVTTGFVERVEDAQPLRFNDSPGMHGFAPNPVLELGLPLDQQNRSTRLRHVLTQSGAS